MAKRARKVVIIVILPQDFEQRTVRLRFFLFNGCGLPPFDLFNTYPPRFSSARMPMYIFTLSSPTNFSNGLILSTFVHQRIRDEGRYPPYTFSQWSKPRSSRSRMIFLFRNASSLARYS